MALYIAKDTPSRNVLDEMRHLTRYDRLSHGHRQAIRRRLDLLGRADPVVFMLVLLPKKRGSPAASVSLS